MNDLITSERLWILFGFFAQFMFFLRFATQWYASEKKKQSIIPMSFWYLSVVGTLLIVVYSIHRKDIVFIVANILSLAIYFRNISLRKQSEKDKLDEPDKIAQ